MEGLMYLCAASCLKLRFDAIPPHLSSDSAEGKVGAKTIFETLLV